MHYIDHKYIGLISPRLEKFKKKNPRLWNFRCPLCGDSKDNKIKARGYLFEHKDDIMFKCHNCGASMGFSSFMDNVDQNLKREYILEKFGSRKRALDEPEIKMTAPVFKKTPLKGLKSIAQLEDTHPAKQYVNKRRMPESALDRLYFVPKFKAFTNAQIPNKFESLNHDEPRLLIPFFTEDGNLFAFQGRSFDPQAEMRYITIIIDKSIDKLFGLDKVDYSKPVYVTEGPLDSLFIPNAIAMAGADFNRKDGNYVVVYDNEPRNPEIIRKIDMAIKYGHSVCVWDSNIKEKDINEMVLSGMTPDSVYKSIRENTYSGLQATLNLNKWKKM